MDFEADFLETVKSAVAKMLRDGKATSSESDDEGLTIKGWVVSTSSRPSETVGNPGKGWWKESWGNSALILSTDGEFWDYHFSGVDEHEKPTALYNVLTRRESRYLVGNAGKPFSKIKAQIERLPYQ